MADDNQIQILMELDSAKGELGSLLRDLSKIVKAFGGAEGAANAFIQKAKQIGKATKGEDAANAIRQQTQFIKAAQQLLNGSFDDSANRLKVLSREIAKVKSETVNMIAELTNAQKRAADSVSRAVREQGVQQFFGKNTLKDIRADSDLASLQARREAEVRLQNQQILQGRDAGALSVKRLQEIEAKIKSITDLNKANETVERRVGTIREGIAKTEVRDLTTISRVDQLRVALQREELKLEQLRVQANGQITTAVRQQADAVKNVRTEIVKARQEEAANRRTQQGGSSTPTLTPTQIAERGNENVRARLSLNGGADFFKIQTQILANYRLVTLAIQTLRSGAQFVVEFEQSMKQFQAITGATNEEVVNLSKSFLDLSSSSRFSGDEIAKAAVIMGQAGLSARQVDSSIEAVVRLATATGTDLSKAVDLATSIMGTFNVRASEMSNVVDIVSGALNQSKLDAQKLALGIQYAGNIAATTGVSFTELTTALAAMSNAGVKSGSTLGTGMRQLIQDITAPTAKLTATFDRLGITWADIDVKSQGLFGVLKNLKAAGFTVADAMSSMELRGAAAFANLSKQLGTIDELQQSLILSGDAAKASEVQMDSLDSAFKRVGNAAKAMASVISKPLAEATKGVLGFVADTIKGLAEWKETLQVLTTVIGTVAVAAIGKWVFGLAAGLLGVGNLVTGLKTLISFMMAASSAASALQIAIAAIGKSNLIFAGVSLALSGIALAWSNIFSNGDNVSEKLDKVTTSLNSSKGRFDEATTTYQAVQGEIDKLNDRYSRLSTNSEDLKRTITELNSKFKDMGFFVSESAGSVDDLIKKLGELSAEQIKRQGIELKEQKALILERERLEREQAAKLFGASGVAAGVGNSGLSQFGVTVGRDNKISVPVLGGRGKQFRDIAERAFAAAQAVNLSKEEDINSKLTEFYDIKKQIADEEAALAGKVGKDSETARERLRKLKEFLDVRIKSLSGLKKNFAEEKVVNSNISNNEFAASGIPAQINDLIAAGRRESGEIAEALRQAVAGGADKDKAKISAKNNKVALLNELRSRYDQLTSSMDEAMVKKFLESGGGDRFGTFISDLMHDIGSEEIEILKFQQPLIEKKKSLIESQIKTLSAKINPQSSRNVVEALGPQLDAAYDNLKKTELELVKNKRRQSELTKETSTQLETDSEVSARIEEKRTEAMGKWHDNLKHVNQLITASNESLGLLPRDIKELGTRFKQINDGLKRAVDAANNIVQQQQTKIQAASFRFNGNFNRISDVQIQSEQDKLEKIQISAQRQRIAAYDAASRQMQALVNDYQSILDRFTTDKEKLDAEIQNKRDASGKSLSEEEINAKISQRRTLESQILTLKKDQSSANEKLKTDQQELLQQQDDLNTKLEEQQSIGLGEGFRRAFDQYTRQTGATKDLNVQIIDSYKTVFGAVDNSMATFVKSTTSHTATVAQAFKTMGISILQSMQNLAAEMAAKGLLRLLFNVVGNAILGSQTPSNNGSGTSVYDSNGNYSSSGPQFGSARMGGAIRRAGGGITGHISTRDSIPTLTMPGEWVVQKSAVDSVGQGFMQRLNSMGARALDMKMPMLPAGRSDNGVVNVWVVAPNQVPPPGPKDIIATIAEDISRGGVTKKLIKQVQMGGAPA